MTGDADKGHGGVGGPSHHPGAYEAHQDLGNFHLRIKLIDRLPSIT